MQAWLCILHKQVSFKKDSMKTGRGGDQRPDSEFPFFVAFSIAAGSMKSRLHTHYTSSPPNEPQFPDSQIELRASWGKKEQSVIRERERGCGDGTSEASKVLMCN